MQRVRRTGAGQNRKVDTYHGHTRDAVPHPQPPTNAGGKRTDSERTRDKLSHKRTNASRASASSASSRSSTDSGASAGSGASSTSHAAAGKASKGKAPARKRTKTTKQSKSTSARRDGRNASTGKRVVVVVPPSANTEEIQNLLRKAQTVSDLQRRMGHYMSWLEDNHPTLLAHTTHTERKATTKHGKLVFEEITRKDLHYCAMDASVFNNYISDIKIKKNGNHSSHGNARKFKDALIWSLEESRKHGWGDSKEAYLPDNEQTQTPWDDAVSAHLKNFAKSEANARKEGMCLAWLRAHACMHTCIITCVT